MQICEIRVRSQGHQGRTCVGATGKVEETTPGSPGGENGKEERGAEIGAGARSQGGDVASCVSSRCLESGGSSENILDVMCERSHALED